ncbi:MAG TPA: hypothetical protein V6C82_09265 [Chroococcales cyanobacterium]
MKRIEKKAKLAMTVLALVFVAGCGSQNLTSPTLGGNSTSTRMSGLTSSFTEAKRDIFSFTSFKLSAGSKLVGVGTYKGYSFKGSAVVSRFDEQNVDLLVNVRKALVINADVHIVIQAQEDGTISFLAKRVDGDPNKPNEQSGALKILKVEPNRSVFEYTDGKPVTVSAQKGANGHEGLTIAYADVTVTLEQANN